MFITLPVKSDHFVYMYLAHVTAELESGQVTVLRAACTSLLVFGIVCLLAEAAWPSPAFHILLPVCFRCPTSTAIELKRGPPSESWVQVCPRPDFSDQVFWKARYVFPKMSHSFIYLTTGICPLKQVFLDLGLVCWIVKFYVHLYNISGFY